MGGWGVPVDEQSTTGPAEWGTPVDEGLGTLRSQSPQRAPIWIAIVRTDCSGPNRDKAR